MVGNPHRIVKEVTDEQLHWKTEGTRLYQQLPFAMQAHWQPCEPLRDPALQKQETMDTPYKPWHKPS